ncbi:MAG: alanine racemase, partial [Xanthomonadales bacterium]|nr:alanine racemase [Xanthomonadales bacterium]NIX12414.1 alanine racemase [Xanthomonadales bacterium]
DYDALRHNLAVVRRMAPDSQVASVVKADAYGHGIGGVARSLEGSDLLAVATVGEMRQVRDSGWGGRLLLLEGFAGPEEFDEAQA